ncbi:MAG: histidine phosphatase family protein [Terriglobales bacterium]
MPAMTSAGGPSAASAAETERSRADPEAPSFQAGDIAPCWSGPVSPATLSDAAERELISLCRLVGNKDVAARRWEVEQEWEMRLYHRGNQNLLPRRGGGWVVPPNATIYNNAGRGRNNRSSQGQETNIIAAYGSIITAALGRDLPQVRFEPQDPGCDADIAKAASATRFARLFAHNNDLLTFQDQLIYYLFTGGRAILCCDYVLDAQRYGREQVPDEPEAEVPESGPRAVAFYVMRHGETALNKDGLARGRSEVPLDPLGQSQVQQAVDWLKGHPVSAVIASPLERSQESAAIVAKALGVPIAYDERLESFDLGTLAGQPVNGMRQAFQEARSNPNEPVGGDGETFQGFEQRVDAALADFIGQFYSRPPGTPPVLIVTHDSVLRQMAEAVNGPGGWLDGFTPPGGVAMCEPITDGVFRVHPVFPSTPPLPASPRSRPRGREIMSAYGKLEAHVPINCQSLAEMPFVQLCREYDVSIVKAMFPDKADKIHPGGGGSGGENELDRIARINVNLALDASYVTGDSMVRDVTVRRTFQRPAAFMNTMDMDVRAELMEAFPEGCEVVMAGETFIHARACAMEDHLTLVQAFPGSGMNRLALGSTILSVQKRLNNWLDLMNDYFVRTVANRYVDARLIDVAALANQPATPGNYVPLLDPDGAAINPANAVFVEPTPTPQASMPQFIQQFMNEVPQLLVGATPTLYGSLSNSDTPVGTASLQRDQALARLTLTWHALTEATANYFLQAVQLAARCRTEAVCGAVSSEAIRIELSDLKGHCLARPESGPNFPESWAQKQFRIMQLMNDASNPVIAQVLKHPRNLELAKNAIGIEGIEIIEAAAYEKQMGELDLLGRAAPLPNPEAQQAQQQAAMAMQQAQANPALAPQAQQAMQAASKIPPMVSSVTVDPDFDQHEAEYQALVDFINGPEGRRMRHGTSTERAGFANIRLHALEHKALIPKPDNGAIKPPHVSVNYRDLPPQAAAEALDQAGIGVPPQEVAGERMRSTQLKRAGKVPLEATQ